MRPRQLLDSFSLADSRPLWSYHHTGTVPRLISFICHSCENTRGVVVFFPFWNVSKCGCFDACRASRKGLRDQPTLPYPLKSLPLNVFADPHPLTPFVTIFYKNGGGEGAPLAVRSLSLRSLCPYPHKSNRIISFADPHALTIIESYRYKNHGGGGEELIYLLMSSFASRRFELRGQTGRFLIFLVTQKPFTPTNNRSTLIFDHSIQNT
jgi:hypothetical protein